MYNWYKEKKNCCLVAAFRSDSGEGRRPTIRREEHEVQDYCNDDHYLGEQDYYSGEEYYEDDSMLSGNRWGYLLNKMLLLNKNIC